MKKLLSFLSVISLVGFTTTSVIACGSKLDNTTEEGGDNSGGDQQNTNAMIELQLKQEIGKKISSHLENIEELFAQNQTTQNQWATSNFDTNTLSASNLVKDLELLINRQTLQEDLENFRTDPGYSFSLFLSGMNSSILGDVKLSQNNAIEIKWTGDEDTPTYQIRINYDVT
ncbi:hypothetical protein FQR65_LT16621 [Abscondita terminalis]|nr:hypothetical protein FQR65_LT16621 [Abscondita terminalis]